MNEEYFIYNPNENAPDTETYSVQRQIVAMAKQLGWKGDVPATLGTHFANEQVRMAAIFVADITRRKTARGDKGK